MTDRNAAYFRAKYSCWDAAAGVLRDVRTDYERAHEFFTPPEAQRFRQYYGELVGIQPGSAAELGAISGICRRIEPAMSRPRQPGETLLDVGCGLGSYSLTFARAGFQVVAVDLSEHRVAAARRRAAAHGLEQMIDFRHQNVFRTLEQELFNVIWVHEAISHVDPAERFLDAAASSLAPHGIVVISDHNGANLLIQLRHLRHRGLRIRDHRVDPETGQAIGYRNERTFTRSGLRRLLESRGLTCTSLNWRSVIPPWARHSAALVRLGDIALSLPGLGLVAGGFVIAARKGPSH